MHLVGARAEERMLKSKLQDKSSFFGFIESRFLQECHFSNF